MALTSNFFFMNFCFPLSLKCDTFKVPLVDGGGELSYLFKDYGVQCNTAKYRSFSIYAAFMIFVYPVGSMCSFLLFAQVLRSISIFKILKCVFFPLAVPCMYVSMLWGNRKTLSDSEKMNREIAAGYPTIGHLRFLVDAYKCVSEFIFFFF